MTEKTKIIIISVTTFICVAGAFIGGFYAAKNYYQGKKPIVTITPTGKPTTTIVNIPNTPDLLLQWQKEPLKITGEMKSNDIFLVTAQDSFKKGTQEFKIKTTCPDEGKNIMIFSYVGGIDYRADTFKWQHGASVAYYRMIIPVVGLGIQIIATESNVFIAPGIIVKF